MSRLPQATEPENAEDALGEEHSKVRRAADMISRGMAYLACAVIVLMLILTIADIARRTISGRSIPGVVELGEVAMVAIVFLSVAYAEARREHVAMTLVISRMRPRKAAIMNALGVALVLVIVAWMLIVTTDRALESIATQEYRFGLVRIPVWPARAILALGVAAYFVQTFFRLADDIRAAKDPDPTLPDVERVSYGS